MTGTVLPHRPAEGDRPGENGINRMIRQSAKGIHYIQIGGAEACDSSGAG